MVQLEQSYMLEDVVQTSNQKCSRKLHPWNTANWICPDGSSIVCWLLSCCQVAIISLVLSLVGLVFCNILLGMSGKSITKYVSNTFNLSKNCSILYKAIWEQKYLQKQKPNKKGWIARSSTNTVNFCIQPLFNVLTMREMTRACQAIGLGARRIFLRICKVPALKEAGLAAALSKAAVFRHAKMVPNHRYQVQPKSIQKFLPL